MATAAQLIIGPGHAPEDRGIVRRLFEEYAASLDIDLSFQSFQHEVGGTTFLELDLTRALP